MFGTPDPPAYDTTEVRRGNLAQTISATGKVQAVTTVQVGTQVSGTISEIYVDFNDKVRKGQVIARLDPSQLEAQLSQARANLASAQARLKTAQDNVVSADASIVAAQANVERTDAAWQDAKRNNDSIQEVLNAGAVARRDAEAAQAAVSQAAAQKQQALAQVNQSKAQAQSARSQVEQARAEARQASAAVEIASVNLSRSVIHAPIDGTIISRNVDVGQTVAASLQAPTLFLIANDLTRMQVLADIDEADVGKLRPESKVAFTVDAFPGETFDGRISEIRLAPQTVQNVVTYTAVIDVHNPEMKLKPGMTATITATVAERNAVLTVPNAALRFRPEGAAEAVPTRRPSSGQSAPNALPRAQSAGNWTGRGGVVWVVKGEKLEPQRVRTGMTDGVSTEVISRELQEGTQIAIPAQTAANASRSAPPSNPLFGGGRGMRGGGRR
jgi:HlyD family secretion protein